jgi:hypothetical protein
MPALLRFTAMPTPEPLDYGTRRDRRGFGGMHALVIACFAAIIFIYIAAMVVGDWMMGRVFSPP